MADFLLTRREEGASGSAALPRWRASTAARSDLVAGALHLGPWSLHWSAGPRAPVSTWEREESAALILGDCIDGVRGRLDARGLAERVRARNGRGPNDPIAALALDGYFLAVVLTGHEAVVVSDLLGLYPVYRGDGSDFVASSTALPVAGRAPDPHGLLGILAFHGTVGGRSIVPGVTRMAAGHALIASAAGVVERRTFAWPEEESLASRPVAEQDELLHEAVSRALGAQLSDDDNVGLLLTGGRDSRTLAGLLQRLGRTAVARTVAADRDHEAILARRVAERLGIPHEARPLPDDAFTRGADLHLGIHHLASGISHAYWRGASPALTDLPVRTVTGHLWDVVVGGTMRLSGTKEYGMDMPWDAARPFERRSGVPDEVLDALRDPELRDAHAWAEETMRLAFLAGPREQRLWRWSLGHVGRFYIGMVLRPIAWETWPVVPVLDRGLLEVAARLDSRVFANRRGQDRMLRDRYPDLAAIAHTVENADPRSAVRPSLARRLRARIRPGPDRPGPVSWRGDRRFIWRNTDFHNPGWTGLRRTAEPLRPRLHEYFDTTPLDAYLPPPDGRLTRLDFAAHQGPKLLTALALWLDRWVS